MTPHDTTHPRRSAGPDDRAGRHTPDPGWGTVHEPVMVAEVIEHLNPLPGLAFLDGTAGTGGHAAALARRLVPGGLLVAVDLDAAALEVARARIVDALAPHPVRVVQEPGGAADRPSGTLGAGVAPAGQDRPGHTHAGLTLVTICGNFADLAALVRAAGCERFDGVLLDLGVSSFELDDAQRGFSFQRDGPLDMRMDRQIGLTAEEVVNRYSREELRRIFRERGEERWAGRIASAIVRRRSERPIRTTGDLAAIVAGAVPPTRGRRRLHPATRVFMAIRATVNDEAANLRAVLAQLPGLVGPGGRAAVLAYHSLEDRAVKQAFRGHAAAGLVRLVTKQLWPTPGGRIAL